MDKVTPARRAFLYGVNRRNSLTELLRERETTHVIENTTTIVRRRKEKICNPKTNPRLEDGHFYRFGATDSLDIICVVNGCYIDVEVKMRRGKQSEHQKAFKDALEAAGGTCVPAYSLDDLIEAGISESVKPQSCRVWAIRFSA
jgi:hypothetical protein